MLNSLGRVPKPKPLVLMLGLLGMLNSLGRVIVTVALQAKACLLDMVILYMLFVYV